jgi:tetratricopeptide (TPR) repeat protein
LSGFTQSNLFEAFDSQVNQGLYQQALLSAETIYFTESNPAIKNEAILKKCSVYLLQKDYQSAEMTLDRINFFETSDSFQFSTQLLMATTFYLNEEYENALSSLTRIDLMLPKYATDKKKSILKILCYNEMNKWEESAKELDSLKRNTIITKTALNDSIWQQLHLALSNKNVPKLKSAKAGRNLSMVIPGSGQIYAGNIQEGLVNTFLEVACLGFIGFTFYHHYYASGILVGYALFQRFYKGGLRRVDYLIKEKNKSRVIPYNQHLKELLLQLN